MATIVKNSSTTDNYGNLAAWIGGAVPTQDDAATFNNSTGAATCPITSALVSAATVWMDTGYASGSGTYSVTTTLTSGGPSYRVYGPYSINSGVPNYSIYLADNKTLVFPGQIRFFSTRPSEPVTTHKIWVGNNSAVILNQAGLTSLYGYLSVDPTNPIIIKKEGPGYVYTGRNTLNPASWGNTQFVIVDGEIRLDGAPSTQPIGDATVALKFDPEGDLTRTPKLGFVIGNGSFTVPTRTILNPVTVTTKGTIDVASGFTATFSGATSGSGTLTISGSGVTTWNNNVSVPLNVTGTLTMASTRNITSATITGSGTINMASDGTSTLGSASTNFDASAFTGSINNAFTVAGGTSTLRGFTGAVTVSGGNITVSGTTNNSGYISSIGNATVIVTGSVTGTAGGNSTALAGAGATPATLRFSGSGSFVSSRTLAAQNGSVIEFVNGANSVSNPITATTDATTVTLYSSDANTNTYAGNFTTNQTSGNVNVRAATGSTFVLTGTLSGSFSGRTFAVNNTATDAGTVKVTGAGFSGVSPVTVSYGKLHLNSNSAIGLGGGLTVNPSGTVACSSTVAYAASLTGNVTLAAGSTFKFASA